VVPLGSRDVHRVRHLFDAEHLSLVIDAVIAGNSPAQVWADELLSRRSALVWDGWHSVQPAGAMERAAAWRELLDREIMPAVRGILKAYVTAAAAETVFAGYALQPRERVFYRGGRLAIPDWRSLLPSGFRVSSINDRFAELAAVPRWVAGVHEELACPVGHDTVDEHHRIHAVQGPVLSIGHALHHPVGDRGDPVLGHLRPVHLGQVRADLPVRESLGRQRHHQVLHPTQAPRPLGHHHRREATLTVPRHRDLHRPDLGQQGLGPPTVARVPAVAPDRVVLVVAEMLIHLRL
jgi:hypothetical protein